MHECRSSSGTGGEPEPCRQDTWYLGHAARVVYLLTSIVGLLAACVELWAKLR